MGPYQEMFKIYNLATTWQEFCSLVSNSYHRQTFLSVLSGGWIDKMSKDLYELYHPLTIELKLFLARNYTLATTVVDYPSSIEILAQLGTWIDQVNILRGYLRYAYYVKLDDPDDIVNILDASLALLGSGTPTREECNVSYQRITDKVSNDDSFVINASLADEIAAYLANDLESVFCVLNEVKDSNDSALMKTLSDKLLKINDLHIQMTGKSLLDLESVNYFHK